MGNLSEVCLTKGQSQRRRPGVRPGRARQGAVRHVVQAQRLAATRRQQGQALLPAPGLRAGADAAAQGDEVGLQWSSPPTLGPRAGGGWGVGDPILWIYSPTKNEGKWHHKWRSSGITPLPQFRFEGGGEVGLQLPFPQPGEDPQCRLPTAGPLTGGHGRIVRHQVAAHRPRQLQEV